MKTPAARLAAITGSKVDLAMECLHWTAREDLPEDKSGRGATAMGNPFHENAALGVHTSELGDYHDEWLAQERFAGWLERGRKLLPATYRQEVAYCILPDGTATELGENIERDYAGAMDRLGIPGGICCTLDVVWDDGVADFKTGKRQRPAPVAWQLRLGNVVSNTTRREFHYIDETGDVITDGHTCSPADVETDRRRLVVLMADVIEGRTEPRPGEHCSSLYCPARKVCEALEAHQKEQEKTMGRMTLGNVTKGRLASPLALLLYGTEGIGKSSFAAGAPSPIFLDPDGGTGELDDVTRFPKPESWGDCLEAVDALLREKHEYKTFVLDTADALEALIHRAVCRRGNKKSMADFGFGKGHEMALDLWREFLDRLDALRGSGMHVIILAHAHIKTFQNPAGEDYDRYRLKMHEKAASLLREWPSAVLFANYRTLVRDHDGKTKAHGDGSRVIYTEHRPAWDAKNRYGLPYELPLNWVEFEEAARVGEPASVDAVLAELKLAMESAPGKLQDQTTAAIKRCGKDVRKLSQLLDWLKGKVSASVPGDDTAAA